MAAALAGCCTLWMTGTGTVAADTGDDNLAKAERRSIASGKVVSVDDLVKHDGKDGKGIWVAIDGNVYDVTKFLAQHPGGPHVIRKAAGKDATELYTPIHPPHAIKTLPDEAHVGSLSGDEQAPKASDSDAQASRKLAADELPVVGSVLNLDEFESIARRHLSPQAWAYYSSAGDDEVSARNNRAAYNRIMFRPRILRHVGEVEASTKKLFGGGTKDHLPFYISPAALAKLGHPDGELNLTRAAGLGNVVQGISANASCGLDDMLDARADGQAVVYQLYVNRDRSASEKILTSCEERGVKAVMLTVDAAVMGKRERDMRAKGEVVDVGGDTGRDEKAQGVAAAISGYIDPNLDWSIVSWYTKSCSLPLYIKGIQSVADARLAASTPGVSGIILSNHGGRSLDYSPAPIDVLIELREHHPETFDKLEVYIDGGIRRGTDVLKALALGATGVGLGRPFLYAQSGYGQEGAIRAIDILRDEIERGMRLLGVTNLDQLGPEYVDILPRMPPPLYAQPREPQDAF
ncbi:cytochrome b2 [Ceraceosorus bombacis]|uniref:L-lactate dehydrogenase (cytochrome) n=1 Tax=Ceraceosorus bombacis TaxID=401625 RepID=A0A0P1B8A8_9BASI|nr:cytochrome b2 [Ceraceosorus bombacis]